MNTRLLSLVVIVSVVPLSTGCGAIRGLLFRPGAACNACTGGLDYGAGPLLPRGPGLGCGAPQCGAISGSPCGCGGETVGSYYGGIGTGYPMDGTIIGESTLGSGYYGGTLSDGYNLDNWIPQENGYVPGSLNVSEGAPIRPMTPTPTPAN